MCHVAQPTAYRLQKATFLIYCSISLEKICPFKSLVLLIVRTTDKLNLCIDPPAGAVTSTTCGTLPGASSVCVALSPSCKITFLKCPNPTESYTSIRLIPAGYGYPMSPSASARPSSICDMFGVFFRLPAVNRSV